jgi:hypothetical protein
VKEFKIKYLVSKERKIKKVLYNKIFNNKKAFSDFLIEFAILTLNLKKIDGKQKEFMIASIILNSEGVDIGDKRAINLYKNRYGFPSTRMVYDYRSFLLKKGWLEKGEYGVKLNMFFDINRYEENVVFSTGIKKERDEIVRQN